LLLLLLLGHLVEVEVCLLLVVVASDRHVASSSYGAVQKTEYTAEKQRHTLTASMGSPAEAIS
jgi:hypothetical protein